MAKNLFGLRVQFDRREWEQVNVKSSLKIYLRPQNIGDLLALRRRHEQTFIVDLFSLFAGRNRSVLFRNILCRSFIENSCIRICTT